MSSKLVNWIGRCRNCGGESPVQHDPAVAGHVQICPRCKIEGYFELVRETPAHRSDPPTVPSASTSAETAPAEGGPLTRAIRKLRKPKEAKP